ncbi:MAG: RNA methyltransferase [Alphaproteobacteria bacterium]|nr:RNA methyltransferase [Alphaproteobacteria bacterium]
MKTPSILLVRPQMGENIGAAARAMANFGLKELRLVAPRDGWPNPKASDTAGKALDIIDDASVHEDVKSALADCQFVLATTARERAMNLPVMEMREAMQLLRTRAARGEKCALMFGPERTGLENEDIALADAVVSIPVAPEYTSLNIGQAVVVAAYEWFMTVAHDATGGEAAALPAAPRAQLEGLLGQLEAALDGVNFWRVPEKKDIMWRNLRATLVRAGLSEQEIASWRGVIRALRQGE